MRAAAWDVCVCVVLRLCQLLSIPRLCALCAVPVPRCDVFRPLLLVCALCWLSLCSVLLLLLCGCGALFSVCSVHCYSFFPPV